MSHIAIIADDFTGACDAASQLRQAGFSARALLAWHAYSPKVDFEVTAINTGTRDMAPEQAVDVVSWLAAALRQAGTSFCYKKVDSLLRGQPLAETAACLLALDYDYTLLCPAFPDNGREFVDGKVFLHGRQVPWDDKASLPAGFCQTFSLDDVRQGAGHLAQRLRECARGGPFLALVDAQTKQDLAAIAAAINVCGKKCLAAGSAGLIGHLAPGWRGRKPTNTAQESIFSLERAGILLVSGSFNRAALAQLDCLELKGQVPIFRIPAERLGRQDASVISESILDQMRSEHGKIAPNLAIALTGQVSQPDAGLAQALARLACALDAALRPGSLILTGGETAACVLSALGIKALALLDEPLPGIPASQAQGRLIITKSGGFGADDALNTLIAYAENAFKKTGTQARRIE